MSIIASDWASPKSGTCFTGYIGNPLREGPGGPSGTLALCVANTPIPCKVEGMAAQKSIQFTVINIRKKGWSYAPWKKPSGKNAKTVRDDNTKELFENHEFARNDVTMERVGRSVLMYSFLKDGQAKGERVDTAVSTIGSGQTFRIHLQSFMYEEKKGGDTGRNVFPSDIDVIPAFSVLEIMFSPANQNGFDQGYGLQLARLRQCEFSLYSLVGPLGLNLLPSTYEDSVMQAEICVQGNQGIRKVLEDKNTGFFGKITKGAYLVKYNDDYRLLGPKESQSDPNSKHLNVMDGGVFAIDIRKEDLLRFTNANEEEEDDSLTYAQFIVELAAAAGALDCYVIYNEYLLRNDPNRSPFTGVPLINSDSLLDFVRAENITGVVGQRFPLPFDFSPQEKPYLTPEPIDEIAAGEEEKPRILSDLVLASENAHVGSRSYLLTLGDSTEEDIMRFLFVPKTGASRQRALAGRQDYRILKKRKIAE